MRILSLFVMVVLGGVAIFAAQRINTQRLEQSKADTPEVFIQEGLREKAQQQGRVRVLVKLNEQLTPEINLDVAQKNAQREKIKTKQRSVKDNLFAMEHKVLAEYKTVPYINIEVTSQGLEKLQAMRGIVTAVIEDIPGKTNLNFSADITQARQMWGRGYNGEGMIVAVADDAIEPNHPFLTGKIIHEICFTDCPNGTDLQEGAGSASVALNPGCASDINKCKHGTAVTGIIAGNPVTMGVGSVVGIAQGAKIIFMRVESADGLVWTGDGVEAMDWLADNYTRFETSGSKVAALNYSISSLLSFSDYCDNYLGFVGDPYRDVVNNLYNLNIPTIAATGNSSYTGAIESPACIYNAIPVSSTNKNSPPQIASSSNLDSNFPNTLLAPGHEIYTSTVNGGYAVEYGTSFAAPHVAAAFALLRKAVPTATINQISQALRESGLLVQDTRESPNGVYYPFIQISAAQDKLVEIITGASLTSSCSAISGTNTTCNAGQTTYVPPAETAVLQASTFADMVLVTVAYAASPNTTAQVASASYCGQALQRVGNRTQYTGQTMEMWYKINPSSAGNCQTAVNFTVDPGHRVVSTTRFHNIDTVSPIVGTAISSGSNYPPGTNQFQVGSTGPKDSILICGLTTYPNWPNNFIQPDMPSGRHLWGSTQTQSNLVQSNLASSYQRTSDNQSMTVKYTSSQSFPWSGVCANFRVKPFTPAPVPSLPPNPSPIPGGSPTPAPTATPISTATPGPTPTPVPTATPAPAGGLPFSVDLKLNNSDGPVQVIPGTTGTISWTINGGASCTASGGNFSGTKTGTGSQGVTIPSIAPYGFSVTCKGPWGLISDSVIGYAGAGGFNLNPILKVNGSDGAVTLTAGSSVAVTWKNPPGITYTSCTASSAWTGAKAITGGTQNVTALTAGNKIFALSCVSAGTAYVTRRYVNVEAAGTLPPNNVITGGYGLKETWYIGRNFETQLSIQTLNGFPNYDFGSSGRPPGSPGGAGGIDDNFSARWTAQIYPADTAEHTFTAVVDDGLRLWVGDRLLIDSFTYGGRRVLTGKINLVAGRAYPLRAEYFEATGDAAMIMTVGSAFSGGGPASVYMTPVDQTSYSNWKLNETSGTPVSDSGTLGTPGTLFGSPTRNNSCRSGGCINFDGVNDYISVGDKNDMIGNQMTLSAWVNVPSFKNYNFIISKLGGAGNYRLYMDAAGKVRFGVRNTANTYQEHISTRALTANTWQHVAVTFNQTTKTSTIYINGVADTSKTNYTVLRGDTVQALEIGRSGSYYFRGMIDEVRMYPRLLTPTEITNLFNIQNVLGNEDEHKSTFDKALEFLRVSFE